MGCEFNYEPLDAKTDAEAVKEVGEMIDRALYDHGHAGYSGTMAEAGYPTDSIKEIDDDPEDWLGDHCEKWEPALIVKTPDGKYHVGALCSS